MVPNQGTRDHLSQNHMFRGDVRSTRPRDEQTSGAFICGLLCIGDEEFLASDLNIPGLDRIGNDQARGGRSGADFHAISNDAQHTGVLFHKVDVVQPQFFPIAAQDSNGVVRGKGGIALQNDAAHIRVSETTAGDLIRRKDAALAENGHIQEALGVALFAEGDIAHFKVIIG